MALVAVVLVAAGLRLWRLDQNGYGNTYYAAAVRSMQASWSNFFFGSFDPAGLVTVDKPPGAIWIQAAVAKLLGFRGPSLLLPEALMGVASVALTSHLVRRVFGPGAGLLAGLMLAITPVCVAVDRDNLPDPALVLVLLLAEWAASIAAETGRPGPLIASAALVGVGFNIKMLAAFVVLPTFSLCYLAAAPIRVRARLGHLTLATVVLVAVSLSWSIAVELTPKHGRPYIGGSTNNSAFDLALGYNGLGRVFGGSGNLGPPGGGRSPGPAPGAGGGFTPGGFPPGFPPGGPGGGMPPMFGGPPGLLRFAGPIMAGQITWLFPLAILGAGVAAARSGRPWPISPKHVSLLLWAGWLRTHWAVFTFARGIFHEYYTTIMGPAVAALAGVGAIALCDEWRRGEGRGYLPMALVLTAAWQASIVGQSPEIRRWLLPALGVATLASVLVLVASRWLAARRASVPWTTLAAAVGLAALLIGPAAWSLAPVVAPVNGMMPSADPSSLTGGRGGGMFPMPPGGMDRAGTGKLVGFLRANNRGERIFVAAFSSMDVSSIIIETGENAVSLGGFMGADPVLTAEGLASMVEGGELRFVLIGGGPGGGMPMPGGGFPGGGPPGAGGPGNPGVLAWVREHGKLVDAKLWKDQEPAAEGGSKADTGTLGGPMGWFRRMGGAGRLYDCKPGRGPIGPIPEAE